MGILKPVLILAILSSALLCNNAWATTPPPRVGATPEAKPDSAPVQKTPARKPVKRRAVRQIIDGTPPPAAAPQVYHPPPGLPPVGVAPQPSPLILNGCTGGVCTDVNGAQYHGGVGTTLIGPQGRVCSNNGVTAQCF